MQLVIPPNHSSSSNSADKQVLSHASGIKGLLAVALNGAVRQDPYSRYPRDSIDDSLCDPLSKKLHIWIDGSVGEGQYCQGVYFAPVSWPYSKSARSFLNRDKSISLTGDGFNIPRIAGGVSQRLTHSVHCLGQTVFEVDQ